MFLEPSFLVNVTFWRSSSIVVSINSSLGLNTRTTQFQYLKASLVKISQLVSFESVSLVIMALLSCAIITVLTIFTFCLPYSRNFVLSEFNEPNSIYSLSDILLMNAMAIIWANSFQAAQLICWISHFGKSFCFLLNRINIMLELSPFFDLVLTEHFSYILLTLLGGCGTSTSLQQLHPKDMHPSDRPIFIHETCPLFDSVPLPTF